VELESSILANKIHFWLWCA